MDTFEDHWAHLVPHLDRLAAMVERHRGGCPVAPAVGNRDYMSVFTFIYSMATDVRTLTYTQPLYEGMARYATAYTARVVTPALATALRRGEYFKALATEWRSYVHFRKWFKAYFPTLTASSPAVLYIYWSQIEIVTSRRCRAAKRWPRPRSARGRRQCRCPARGAKAAE